MPTQSGILSAVGLVPENVWRDVPLTVLSGTNYGVGVTNQNPHRFCILEPGGGLPAQPEIFVGDGEVDGDVETNRTGKLSMSYGGGYSFKADAENLHYPLLGVLGRDIQTQIQTATTAITSNVYRHVFTPNKLANSFACEEIFGDGTYGRLSGGVLVQRVELDFGRIVMARMNLMPYRQVPNHYHNSSDVLTDYTFGSTAAVIPSQMSSLGDGTNTWQRTAAPGYVDVNQEQPEEIWGTGPFVFAGWRNGTATVSGSSILAGAPDFTTVNSAYLAIDGVAYTGVEILEGMSLWIDRKIDSSMIGGSGYDMGSCTGSGVTIGGNITLRFTDDTAYRAAIRHSRVAINFRLVGVKIGTGGTKRYQIEVFIPNCKLTVPQGPFLNDGPIDISCTWRARKDPTLGYSLLIALQNQFDTSQVGGQMRNEASKPLGWVATLASSTSAGAATATYTTPKNIAKGDVHNFQEAGVNSGNAVQRTVSSINYGTGVVTYTANIGFIFTAAASVTRTSPNGLGGWSNA